MSLPELPGITSHLGRGDISSWSRHPRARRNPASAGAPGKGGGSQSGRPESGPFPREGTRGRTGACLPHLSLASGGWVCSLEAHRLPSLPHRPSGQSPAPCGPLTGKPLPRESGYLPPPSATGGGGTRQDSGTRSRLPTLPAPLSHQARLPRWSCSLGSPSAPPVSVLASESHWKG